jgi:hypothetical protein
MGRGGTGRQGGPDAPAPTGLRRVRRRVEAVTIAAVAVAAGLVLAVPPSATLAQSGTGVPLHPDYPADLLPIPDTMTPRISDVCVSIDRLYGDLASGSAPQPGDDEHEPVRARYHVGLITDLGPDEVLDTFRPYLEEIDPDVGPTELRGSIGDLTVSASWMDGQSNVYVSLPPQQALEAQAAMPPFPDERSDLPEVDTLRAYETCHGYHDSLGGSLGFIRFHEGAQLTGQELVDELTERRGGSEGFESYVFDDGGGRVVWQDGDHRVSVLLDAYERISEVVYLPLAAAGDAGDDLPAGAAAQELDREDDAGDADAGAAGADAEVEDDATGGGAPTPTTDEAAEGGGRGLGVGVGIAGGILGVAAVAGGMALGRSRRSGGGTPPKEPATVGAAPPAAKPAPLSQPATPTKTAPPPAKPAPPPAPRATGGPIPPPPPRPKQDPLPEV